LSDPVKLEEEPAAGVTGFAALRYPEFALFFFGKFFAISATYMITTALGYQVYDRTEDPMSLAYIALAIAGPAFFFALFTGYVADRFERRTVLVVCYVIMCVAAAGLFLLTTYDFLALAPIFALLVLLGTGRAFYSPAASAIVPALVPVGIFPNAIAWNNSASKTAQICGPAAGGLLYLLGPEVVYALSAVSFALGAVALARVTAGGGGASKGGLSLKSLLAGLVYVYRNKLIFGSITVDLLVLFAGGVVAMLPIFARDVLEVGPAGAGFLRSAMAVGGLLAVLTLVRVPIERHAGAIMFAVVAIFGVAIVIFGLSTSFPISALAMVVMGASDMVSVFIRNVLLQIATPDDMRGRVSAVNSVFVAASNEIGDFRASVMAAWVGAVPAVLIGGVSAILVAAVCWKIFPDLARVDRMDQKLQIPVKS
jgi:MFS family permease